MAIASRSMILLVRSIYWSIAGRGDRGVWPWLAVSFIVLVALIIWIILLVWACTPGTPGPNRFGHDPFAI
jgi:uncharacterized membrane protein YhaH (DUF805 family)